MQKDLDLSTIARVMLHAIDPKLPPLLNIMVTRMDPDQVGASVIVEGRRLVIVVPPEYKRRSHVVAYMASALIDAVSQFYNQEGLRIDSGLDPDVEGAMRFVAKAQIAAPLQVVGAAISESVRHMVTQAVVMATFAAIRREEIDDEGEGMYSPDRMVALAAVIARTVAANLTIGPTIRQTYAGAASATMRKLRELKLPLRDSDINKVQKHLDAMASRLAGLESVLNGIEREPIKGRAEKAIQIQDRFLGQVARDFQELLRDPDENDGGGGIGANGGGGDGKGEGEPLDFLSDAMERMRNDMRKMGATATSIDEQTMEEIRRQLANAQMGQGWGEGSGNVHFTTERHTRQRLDFYQHPILGNVKRRMRVRLSPLDRNKGAGISMVPLHVDPMLPEQDDRWPVPVYAHIKGKTVSAPMVMLAVDMSGSMSATFSDGASLQEAAMMVAQLLTERLKEQWGVTVIPILFSSEAMVYLGDDAEQAFYSGDNWNTIGYELAVIDGGTSFGFVPQVLDLFPQHSLILITDGESSPPQVKAEDVNRVAVIQINESASVSDIDWARVALKASDVEQLVSAVVTVAPHAQEQMVAV